MEWKHLDLLLVLVWLEFAHFPFEYSENPMYLF